VSPTAGRTGKQIFRPQPFRSRSDYPEHEIFGLTHTPATRKQLRHSVGSICWSSWSMHFLTCSMVRAFALRNRLFYFENAWSIGFRSGL
jgi:hypothetical protein